MKEKLRAHFLSLGPRRFVIGAVILLVILDLVTGYYLKQVWQRHNISELILQVSMKSSEVQASDLSAQTKNEITGLANKAMDFMLFLILINNLFFYFFYLRKKLWAQGYILTYTLFGAVMTLFLIFDDNGMGVAWWIVNAVTVPIYIYLFLGVKLLKPETTLVPEKKAQ